MTHLRLSQKAYELVKKLSEERGVSMAQFIEELVNLYVGGSRTGRIVEKIVSKFIDVEWEAKCCACGRTIRPGERAYYIAYIYEDGSKSSRVKCVDCYAMSDPSLWKRYLRSKELQTVVNQLRAEADRLAEEVKLLEQEVELARVKKELLTLWSEVSRSLRGGDDVLKKFEELSNKLEELLDRVSSAEATIKLAFSRMAERKQERPRIREREAEAV